ncbi:nuclear segregation protein Bfr1 [Crepidotus variabilis]|uniref:Nuclear segregation protein Bfr1 n=1 Tax=Crepidotus variabilis TaxID=179855 RepID=A0A9P6JVX0_9AGAR|nr:nuclear segregation protein Bfr1 [Crepidotus variabilis]
MAPAPKSKATSNGTAANKTKATSPSGTGTATPVSTTGDKKDTLEQLATVSGGKPDKKNYDDEQAKIKSEIDALQVKLSAVRDKINFATKSGPGNERQKILRAELDSIRDEQSTNKLSRGKVFDHIKSLQDEIAKKNKDLASSKSKVNFKSVTELDAHVKHLEKQVESGNLKLADEKRALQEISNAKRSRRILESFQADHEAVEGFKTKLDELRKELDDPAAKAVSERYDAIKAELDEIKKESDEAYAGRSKLFEERDSIQNQLNNLYNQKRESAQNYRDSNDRYWAKVNEDRARRAEKARQQRLEEEATKKREIAERLLEEAQSPAFQAQIEDCRTLIDFFSGKNTGTVTLKTVGDAFSKTEVVGVPKLEIRKVEDASEGLVVRKKKGEDEESYFVGGKGKAKGKKAPKGAASADGASTPTSSGALNVPLATLTALLSLSIPPPASNADLPRVVEDLTTKKTWYEANQARQTAENVAKAQAEIQRLDGKAIPPHDHGEVPAEPVPTPKDGADTAPVEGDAVADRLEEVKEAGAVEAA